MADGPSRVNFQNHGSNLVVPPTDVAATDAAPLPRSTPEAEGADSRALLGFVQALEKEINAVHSVMLVRHGKVVMEGWWAPYAKDDLHVLYSLSKSFSSTAVGFAVQEGLLKVHDLVLSHFPELAPEKPAENMKQMRIFDLLRMVSGHQNDINPKIKSRADGQWVRAFLETEVENKPGTHWVYNSGASYMLCALVQKVSGQSLEAFLEPRLFAPLGIRRRHWCVSPEGINLGDGGLSLCTESIAKFGLLYLQRGTYGGQRLLSEAWVDEAGARQASNGGNPDSNWDHGYGYQFWRNKAQGTYRADGAFGQFCFVLPQYDAVLALTSGTSDMHGVMENVWKHVLPALGERPLPANAAAHAELKQKLASLSLPVQQGSRTSARAAALSEQTYQCEPNELTLESVRLAFSAEEALIEIKDADGSHRIRCGLGQWLRGRTGLQRRISNAAAAPTQGIAASGAWESEDVFTAKLCFHESPYTITSRFTVAGDELHIDWEHNLRWGETKRPRVIGKLAQR
jgi:CubicO group peptidase (beta-lactamase class C family)